MAAHNFEDMQKPMSKKHGLRGRVTSMDSECSTPALAVADAALEKSQRLLDDLLKLGLDVDFDDVTETGSTCTGGCSLRTSSFSDAGSEDAFAVLEPAFGDVKRDEASGSASERIGDHVDTISKLLLLRNQIQELREQKKSMGSAAVQSHLDALEEKLSHVKCDNVTAISKPAVPSPAKLVVADSPAKVRSAPISTTTPLKATPLKWTPDAHALHGVPTPLRATSPVLHARAASPRMLSTGFTSPRAMSPGATSPRSSDRVHRASSRALSPTSINRPSPPSSRRLKCQQVAVTHVYNVWSFQD